MEFRLEFSKCCPYFRFQVFILEPSCCQILELYFYLFWQQWKIPARWWFWSTRILWVPCGLIYCPMKLLCYTRSKSVTKASLYPNRESLLVNNLQISIKQCRLAFKRLAVWLRQTCALIQNQNFIFCSYSYAVLIFINTVHLLFIYTGC